MKLKSKSATIKAILSALCLLCLAACDQISLPHVWGPNEVPPEVTAAPSPIERPPPVPSAVSQTINLRLGDVPSRPKDFPSDASSDLIKQQMENDRAQSVFDRARLAPPAEQSPSQQPGSQP
jgi:hypothetical protein